MSYKLGIVFFLFGSAVSVLLLIFLILTKLIRNPDKRERILGKLVAAIIALFIAGVWCMLAGIKITLAVFGLLGLYALFQHYKRGGNHKVLSSASGSPDIYFAIFSNASHIFCIPSFWSFTFAVMVLFTRGLMRFP